MDTTTRRHFDQIIDSPTAIDIQDEQVWIKLADGRVISTPLARHPWLMNATPEQRANYEIGYVSIWWPDLDEGLDVEWLLRESGTIRD